MAWTSEKVENLKRLWAEGYSASRIAQQLGDVTRNAVIGKVHRLGIAQRNIDCVDNRVQAGKTMRPKKTMRKTTRTYRPRYTAPASSSVANTPKEQVAVPTKYEIVYGQSVTLLELTEKTCRWPIGHPDEENFLFCGAPTLDNHPYCEKHFIKAHMSATTRGQATPQPQAKAEDRAK